MIRLLGQRVAMSSRGQSALSQANVSGAITAYHRASNALYGVAVLYGQPYALDGWQWWTPDS